ncbi:MAG: hypothetical protein AB7U23_12630 [Dehalococcoidia bacterium]
MNRQQMIDNVETTLYHQFDVTEAGWAENIVDNLLAEMGDDSAVFHVRKDAPDTSKAIVDKIRSGTLQQQVLDAMISKAAVFGGATDDELERLLGRSHQSVSGTRNTLVRKGYLVDSGNRRKNSHGNMAIVWYYTGKEVKS